ncbi:MAG: glycosyltransferase family 2 protein, partial [Acidobacteria bacterium]|nr:glycosyltransferase family 2 protein [Acidobacteriota bacterium]
MKKNTVSVTVVTHNSEPFLARCLDSLLAQDWAPLEVIVVDNASQDGTASILAGYQSRLQTTFNSENRGFAAAQNQAIRKANGDWVLALNPDVVLDSDFVSHLVHAGNRDPGIGTVCGKLLSASPNFEVSPERRLDS